mmetsp:Transcript_21067/g.63052  ORF Transcript_21067/g.63052 Transcript_21067/m.63052 type:complete len:205 (+) Transcript_21067:479-1093(+)|eukprot:353590-Chlamydomonas_euryale.AAC.8
MLATLSHVPPAALPVAPALFRPPPQPPRPAAPRTHAGRASRPSPGLPPCLRPPTQARHSPQTAAAWPSPPVPHPPRRPTAPAAAGERPPCVRVHARRRCALPHAARTRRARVHTPPACPAAGTGRPSRRWQQAAGAAQAAAATHSRQKGPRGRVRFGTTPHAPRRHPQRSAACRHTRQQRPLGWRRRGRGMSCCVPPSQSPARR